MRKVLEKLRRDGKKTQRAPETTTGSEKHQVISFISSGKLGCALDFLPGRRHSGTGGPLLNIKILISTLNLNFRAYGLLHHSNCYFEDVRQTPGREVTVDGGQQNTSTTRRTSMCWICVRRKP